MALKAIQGRHDMDKFWRCRQHGEVEAWQISMISSHPLKPVWWLFRHGSISKYHFALTLTVISVVTGWFVYLFMWVNQSCKSPQKKDHCASLCWHLDIQKHTMDQPEMDRSIARSHVQLWESAFKSIEMSDLCITATEVRPISRAIVYLGAQEIFGPGNIPVGIDWTCLSCHVHIQNRNHKARPGASSSLSAGIDFRVRK